MSAPTRRSILAGLAASPAVGLLDVIQADPTLALIERHRAAYDAWDLAKAEATIALDDPSNVRLAAADAILVDLAAMVPRSTAGLVAYIEYFAAYAERDEDETTQHPALASMAAACRALLAPRGGL